MSYLRGWDWRRWWLLLVVVGSVLRAWNIGGPGIWYDEIGSLWMGALPFNRMLAATGADVHPPLYLALVWLAERVYGPDPLAIRSVLSALFSVMALWAARYLAERLRLRPAAILAGSALMIFAPAQIYYAQEARMYALLVFESTLALVFALDRRWGWLALCQATLLWTHNYGAFYAALAGLVGLAQWWRAGRPRPELARMLIFSGLAAASYLPWLGMLTSQMAAAKDAWWQEPSTPGSVISVYYMLMWLYALPSPVEAWGAVLLIGSLTIVVYRLLQTRAGAPWCLAAVALVPLGLALLVEMFYRPVLLHRALIGSSVGMYYLIGWACTWRVPLNWRRAALAAWAPVVALALIWYYPWTAVTKAADPSEMVESIDYQPGDIIMHVNPGTLMGLHFAYTGPADQYILPETPGSRGVLARGVLDALGAQTATLDALPWQRAWLLWGAGPTICQAEDELVAGLLSQYRHADVINFTEQYQLDTAAGGLWLLYR